MFTYTPHTDSGSPEFTHINDELSIICQPGDRGRWLCDWQEPLTPGSTHALTLNVRTTGPEDFRASLFLVWWKDEPGFVVHDTEFIAEVPAPQDPALPIHFEFTVPEGVRPPRVDCRAWSAAGNAHFSNLQIAPATTPPDPPIPPDPDPVPPAHQLTIDLQLNTVTWRVTANEDSITALRIPEETT